MGYAEARLQREVQQLKREVANVKNRERKTRDACLNLAHALDAMAGDAGALDPTAMKGLLELAGLALAPDSDEGAIE